ncbi:MAG: hypothetical protein ACYTBX_01335 [Planctomycetota bacterium]|jgi:hypothetical protein
MSAVIIGRVVFLFVSRQLYHWRGAKHAFTCLFIIATDKAVVNAKMPARQVGFAVTVYAGKIQALYLPKYMRKISNIASKKVIS